jgi:hypothetical protein
MIYEAPPEQDALMQGDILKGCPLLVWELTPTAPRGATGITIRSTVVVLTQACDLAGRKAEFILVAPVHSARQMTERGILTAKFIRDQVRLHRVYGWYFLPAGGALDESIVDLRNLHSMPRFMLDQLVQDGKRVCRISTPYREHLSQHFSTTYSRIGLPEPYPSQPE